MSFAVPSLPVRGGADAPSSEVPPNDEPKPEKKEDEPQMKPPKPQSQGPSPTPPPVPYQPPFWSCKPLHPFKLEVIKGGVVTESIDVSEKEFYVFGRGMSADVVMEHPSCSRNHAILQHRDNGCVYLMDLGSTHGTIVNKKQVKPKTYVEVSVGSVLKFGASTRLFILEGPEELMPPEITTRAKTSEEALAMKAKGKVASRPANPTDLAKLDENGGIAWGFGDDAEEEIEQERTRPTVDLERLKVQDSLSKKQRSAIEKIEKKQQKIMNMEREATAISKKELQQSEGLTEGQSRRLQQINEEKERIMAEIMEIEDQLTGYRDEENRHERRKNKKKKDDDDDYYNNFDEDDDFYDRSKAKAKKKPSKQAANVETTESLTKQLDGLTADKNALLKSIGALKDAMTKDVEDVDELEAYMKEMQRDQRKKDCAKLEKQLTDVETEISRVTNLLRKIAPALSGLSKSSTAASSRSTASAKVGGSKYSVIVSDKRAQTVEQSGKGEGDASTDAEVGDRGGAVVGGGADMGEVEATMETSPAEGNPQAGAANGGAKGDGATANVSGGGDAEDPSKINLSKGGLQVMKSKQPRVPSAPQFMSEQDPKAKEKSDVTKELTTTTAKAPVSLEGSKKRKVMGPTMPPQAAMARDAADLMPPPPTKRKIEPMASGADEGDYNWKPPEGQTGDGKTSLNAKYGY